MIRSAFLLHILHLDVYFFRQDHVRLLSGLGISKWYAQWYAQLPPFKYCIWLSISSFIKIAFVYLADWGSASDTLSDVLSFPPWNIAFGCQFLCFIKITFVCLADWGSASESLRDMLSDTLSFSPSNIAFTCLFLSLIKITFVCWADWGSASVLLVIRLLPCVR